MSQTPNFDRLARPYRWMEFFSFGPWLALTRRTYIDRLAEARHALILGDGDGRFTAGLLRSNPYVFVDAVDASAAMLRALVGRAAPHSDRLCTHLADIRTCDFLFATQATPACDLIATHFFLDCLTTDEILALAVKVRSLCTPSARWLVSDFAIPAGLMGRFVARPLIALLYFAFARLTGLAIRRLPDHAGAMSKAGFQRVEQRTRLGGLLIAELWQADTVGDNPDPS